MTGVRDFEMKGDNEKLEPFLIAILATLDKYLNEVNSISSNKKDINPSLFTRVMGVIKGSGMTGVKRANDYKADLMELKGKNDSKTLFLCIVSDVTGEDKYALKVRKRKLEYPIDDSHSLKGMLAETICRGLNISETDVTAQAKIMQEDDKRKSDDGTSQSLEHYKFTISVMMINDKLRSGINIEEVNANFNKPSQILKRT